jgi:Taurine catabolism dioxygenase TauD, TfdA family
MPSERVGEEDPMTEIRRDPISTPATWRGPELQRRPEGWIHRLTPEQVADLERALAHARATGAPMASLARDDFPLPVLGPVIEGWLHTLQHGRGFLNVKGVPVAGRSEADAALLQWGLGLHLGSAVSQNAAGDLLGHVRDTGADPNDASVRLYKTRVELGFHSDGADLVALLCIRQGRSGGENRLVSTAAIYNEILRQRPDLVPLLYEPVHWDRNEEQAPGEPPSYPLPICRYEDGKLRFFYIPWYIRKAQRHAHVPRLSADQHALLDLIDAIAADPAFHVVMKLEPGEINYLKNNAVLHARSEFVDWDEPERKRYFLRLWLTARGDWADGDAFLRQGIPAREGVISDAEAIARANAG